MKKLLLSLAIVAALAGCAGIVKVGPGETVVGNWMAVTIDSSWNQLNPAQPTPSTLWTLDGVTVDSLRFYAGLKDGDVIEPNTARAKDARPLVFKAGMHPDEIVALYQGMYSRDGSAFMLDKLEPAEFVGAKGFRFQYTVVRKLDDVTLSGVAWAAVREGQLYAMTYTAPRLAFFPRYAPRVEKIARSARLKT